LFKYSLDVAVRSLTSSCGIIFGFADDAGRITGPFTLLATLLRNDVVEPPKSEGLALVAESYFDGRGVCGAGAGLKSIVPTDGFADVLCRLLPLALLVALWAEATETIANTVWELAPNSISSTKKSITRRSLTKTKTLEPKTPSARALGVILCCPEEASLVFLPIVNLPVFTAATLRYCLIWIISRQLRNASSIRSVFQIFIKMY
jgi:hypothetical protein